MFKEIPASKMSIVKRKPIYGIGINDAEYITQPTVNGLRLTCPFYSVWTSILSRCYSESYLDTFKTYIGCSICEEWLSFLSFKSWMITKDWEGGQIDKDIIKPFNKIYSPMFCVFVSNKLNMLLVDSLKKRGNQPRGVSFHKQTGRYVSRLNINGKVKFLGIYDTSKKASDAYIKAKVEIILKAALGQKDPRVSNGLRLHADILLNGC